MGLTPEYDGPSCGQPAPGGALPGECSEVMRDVWLFLDDELDPERRAAVQQHLDDCSPCLEQAGLDIKLKQLLARKCGGDHAPEHLRNRIVTRLVSFGGSGHASATSVTHTSVTQTSVSGTSYRSRSVTRTSVTRTSTSLRRGGSWEDGWGRTGADRNTEQ